MKLMYTHDGSLREVDDTVYRYDIINFLIEKKFPNECRYLEVGVRDPSECFAKIKATHKESVDPCFEALATVDFEMTSDVFFEHIKGSDRTWDIILIDGLHLADQVDRDINNSLKHLAKGGFVVLHDCNPPHWSCAHSDYDSFIKNPRSWNGSVWKAFYNFRNKEIVGVESFTVDTDQGMGIIHKNGSTHKLKNKIENPFFEYGIFSKNRKESLGLITVDEFYQKYQ